MNYATLFIDESGKSSLLDINQDLFLLTGVILDNEHIPIIEGFFKYIKLRNKINQSEPFHSYDVFENPKIKITDIKAQNLVLSLAEFISLIPINIYCVYISKKKFWNALGITSSEDLKGSSEKKLMKEFPYGILASELFRWFGQYLSVNERTGQIVSDSRAGGDVTLVRYLNICKDPTTGPLQKEDAELIKKRCSAICFAQKSYLSGGLEITDLVSYTVFFHIRKRMNSMENIKLPLLWKQIKKMINNKDVKEIKEEEIRSFFKVKKDGVHKYLK